MSKASRTAGVKRRAPKAKGEKPLIETPEPVLMRWEDDPLSPGETRFDARVSSPDFKLELDDTLAAVIGDHGDVAFIPNTENPLLPASFSSTRQLKIDAFQVVNPLSGPGPWNILVKRKDAFGTTTIYVSTNQPVTRA
jgi:hypothetical protein